MRRLFASRTSIFIALAVVFIIGQVLGTFFIRSFFIGYKIDELSPVLGDIADQIAAGTYDEPLGKDFILKTYDLNGKEIPLSGDVQVNGGRIPEFEIGEALKMHIPRVISGDGVAALKRIGDHPAQSILIGRPIVRGGNVIGAVFLMKPASDFSAVLNGFYLIFSMTLIVGTVFIGVFLHLYLKEMKALEQTRRDYIANISHELKSPLASIRALSETLADGMVPDVDTQMRYYAIILRESGSLQRLIDDMLELSRLQSGMGAFEMYAVDMMDFFKDIEDKFTPILDEMGIAFEVNASKVQLPMVRSNEHRLNQLMTILITNAVKFIGEEGRVTVDAEVLNGRVVIKVSDNGIGIDPADLPHIFERFHRGKSSEGHEGTGLGLAIAKAIVTGLGETLEVKSTLGKGSVFMFSVKCEN